MVLGDTTDPRVKKCLDVQEALEIERRPYENIWREIVHRISPEELDFWNEIGSGGAMGAPTMLNQPTGAKKDQYIFDNHPIQANHRFASAVNFYVMPSTQQWHEVQPADPRLKGDKQVSRYCEEYRDALFGEYYSPTSYFDISHFMSHWSTGIYGHGYVFMHDMLSKGTFYQNIHVSNGFHISDRFGRVNGFHWRFALNAKEIKERYNKIPEALAQRLEQKPKDRVNFLHCICEWPMEEDNIAGFQYKALDICRDTKEIMLSSGYKTFPLSIIRHLTLPGRNYSIGPAALCLTDIKLLNFMGKSNINYAKRVLEPTLLLGARNSLREFSIQPGYLNYGYVNDKGQAKAVPLDLTGDPRFALELMQDRRRSVEAAFYNTLFELFLQEPDISATASLLRSQEKGILMAPVVARVVPEAIHPVVSRTSSIMEKAGRAPQPPESLLALGGGLRIKYDSPLTKAQKAKEGEGFLRVAEASQAVGAVEPRALVRINWSKGLEQYARVAGVSESIIRSDDEVDEIINSQAEAQAQAAELEAAEMASGVAKNLGQAEAATRRKVPQQV